MAMRNIILPVLILICLLFKHGAFAQMPYRTNARLTTNQWPAKWISTPDAPSDAHGVYLFRKSFELNIKPASLLVHVSADSRYKVYVNGHYMGNGPARGDLLNWFYETYDIAPFIKQGRNTLSVIVWNFGEHNPVAQHSAKTGLIVQVDDLTTTELNTNNSWKTIRDSAYSPIPIHLKQIYYVAGPGERFQSDVHPWDWMEENFDDSNWLRAEEKENGMPLKALHEYGSPPAHLLTPRRILPLKEKEQRFKSIRRSNISPERNVDGGNTFNVPANTVARVLYDQGELTTAYPLLQYSGGENSVIKITYSESLFDSSGLKGNRNEVDNKVIYGNHDIVLPDGGTSRSFQTLWWRAFRYVELEISTKDDPIIINNFSSIFTAYPLEEIAKFKTDNPTLEHIWNVGGGILKDYAREKRFSIPLITNNFNMPVMPGFKPS